MQEFGRRMHGPKQADMARGSFPRKGVMADLELMFCAITPTCQKKGVEAVRTLEDNDLIKYVAVNSTRPKIGFEAVDRIPDEKMHCQIAISARHPGIAARKVCELHLLERILRFSKHENARGIAGEKLEALKVAQPEAGLTMQLPV